MFCPEQMPDQMPAKIKYITYRCMSTQKPLRLTDGFGLPHAPLPLPGRFM